MARRWVHHHSRRLVHDRDIPVFVDDVEGYLLGAGLYRICLGDVELDDVPGRDMVRGIGKVTVELNLVTLDQPGSEGAAELRRLLGDESIEPGRRGRGDQLLGCRIRYVAIIMTTPMVIAESARLNTGKKWKLMKSVTVPNAIRS